LVACSIPAVTLVPMKETGSNVSRIAIEYFCFALSGAASQM
jgi:hypothetical protein